MQQRPCRIVIADDHEAMRHGVRSLLESRGNCEVVGEAGDGRDALQLVRKVQPDVAVLDYALPGMNGLDLTRAIKREVPSTEVVLYTMHDREAILAEALDAGALGYVLKSDAGADLIAAVETTARHKRYLSATVSERLDYFIKPGGAGMMVLTPREREIVQLIAEGKINKQVAYLLDISVKTVETHRATVMQKLKLRTTADLVLYAVRNNIVPP